MSTTVPVQCPTCQKSYNAPSERAGARFKCKQCGETLTVPRPAPPERPVVMPAAAPTVPPVVAPATPPKAKPASPVVMPSQPAAGRPVVPPAAPPAPSPEPARTHPPRAPRPSPASASRPASRGARREEAAAAPGPRKSQLNLVLMLIGGVAVLAIGGYFAFSKGDAPAPPTPPPGPIAAPGPAPEKPSFDPEKRTAELKTETGTASAGQIWSLVQKLDAEAKAWREKGAPEDAVLELTHQKEIALEDLLKLESDHAGARAMRDEVKYAGELDAFDDASYLSDSDRDLVRRNRLSMATLAGENGGWISRKAFETQVKPLVDRFTAAREAHEALATSPFGRAAKTLETDTQAYLATTMGGSTAFRAFVHKPYVIFVEENPGWSPQAEAKSLFSPLKAILEAFLKEFSALGLEPLDVPVPVVYFMSEKRYGEYNDKIGNTGMRVLAHYEPQSGRLVLNRGVNHEVIIHEGTHQIFDKYTKNMLPHPKQSFWFQEGIAEWFGGSNRLQAPDGSWMYETGVLLDGRLDSWRSLEKDAFPLADLLAQTYGKRNEYMTQPSGQNKIGLVYAQGWFLIYFLNHFDVGPDGLVKIGSKGKYADGWNQYLQAELNGRTGKKVFMECLKLDDAALEKMNEEFKTYFEFVMRKRNIGQVKEKKLVAWYDYVNKRGEKNGEKEDDLLIAPPRGGDK